MAFTPDATRQQRISDGWCAARCSRCGRAPMTRRKRWPGSSSGSARPVGSGSDPDAEDRQDLSEPHRGGEAAGGDREGESKGTFEAARVDCGGVRPCRRPRTDRADRVWRSSIPPWGFRGRPWSRRAGTADHPDIRPVPGRRRCPFPATRQGSVSDAHARPSEERTAQTLRTAGMTSRPYASSWSSSSPFIR